MKHDKALKILETVFGLIGVIMLVVGIIVFASGITKKNTYKTTDAVISKIDSYSDSDGDRHYTAYVTYRVPGTSKLNETKLDYYSSSMDVGDTIEVRYNPDNPNEIVVLDGYWIAAGILTLMGVVFGGSAAVMFIIELRKNIKMKNLLASGQYIMAKIDSINLNINYSVNGRHPYNIICKYYDDYKDVTYIYKSDNLWFDPEEIIASRGIEELKVYIDRSNPKKYYVDTTVLENKVVDLT